MITFKKIRWKNLLSTGNVFTEIELDKDNTTLIIGDNGSGKSTLLDALLFVLFGKPFRKINKPQLLNSINKKGLVVEIEFTIARDRFKIIRGMKPNVFEVYKNDVLLNQTAEMKDYQEILEKQILKINHKSFCQVVILGSATFQPFMQLTTGQRREIIEDLLDLQIFTTMNSLLKDKIQQNNEQIQKNTYDKKLIEEKISIISEHIQKNQQNIEHLITEKTEKINELKDLIEIDHGKMKKVTNQIDVLTKKTKNQGVLQDKVNKLSKLKHEIEANLNSVKKEINFFTSHDDCPTCKQPIDGNFKASIINTKEQEVTQFSDGLDKLIDQYNTTNEKINEIMMINDQINYLKMDKYKLSTLIDSNNKIIDNLNREINRLTNDNDNTDISKINELNAQLNSINTTQIELSEEKDVLTSTSYLLKDNGIKARIIKQYVPVINKLINKYLSALDFFVQFELDEEFNETIKSRYRDEFSYSSFSEGEKMKINLAILFTWRAIAKLKNSINTNILIMDEVFDSSLDAYGTEEFMKLLNSLTKDTNTFIISHKTDQLGDKFDKTIKFTKIKNFSKIVGA